MTLGISSRRSTLVYRAQLSDPAAKFVKSLAAKDAALARELALLLISLEHDPEPPGSRELLPSLSAVVKGERVWERPPFVIIYAVNTRDRLVEIGTVEMY